MNLRSGFTLGRWTVYPLEGRLLSDEESRRVQPKSMDVLLCLASAGGEVVERDELLREIWGDRAVSDEPLTRCIGELRRALGDTRAEPEYILTIPKRGYRLLQAVESTSEEQRSTDGPARPQLTVAQKARRFVTLRKLMAGLGVLVLAALVQIAIERLIEHPVDTAETAAPAPETMDRSIAVLPFADMSELQDKEYMSDGIAEELLSLLSKIRELRVISRSSSFSVKGQSVDVRTIAERFNVAYVLEGSVRASGDDVRITAQLIDARTDTHMWSETYDRKLHDIFAIQDEIAQAVVNRLELTLLVDPPKSRETDPEAYALFLQARYLHEQPAGDSLERALDYYKAALEIDENYVPAWVWLAALYDDTVYSLGLPQEEVVRLAFDAIEQALAIDPDDAQALAMSALLVAAWKGDYEAVSANMQRAVELDPANPIVLRWAAIALNGLGQHEDAVRVTEYLFARDPVGNIAKINLAATYLMAGRFEDAAHICEIQVALDPADGPCRSRLITAYLHVGNADAALEQLDLVSSPRVYTRLAPMVYHSLGRQEEFDTAMANLHRAFDDGDTGLSYWIARTYTFMNETDAAFEWLGHTAEYGALDITQASALYTNLHDDPRWDALLAKIGKSAEEMHAIRLVVHLPD